LRFRLFSSVELYVESVRLTYEIRLRFDVEADLRLKHLVLHLANATVWLS
jgi:hypothetical protein